MQSNSANTLRSVTHRIKTIAKQNSDEKSLSKATPSTTKKFKELTNTPLNLEYKSVGEFESYREEAVYKELELKMQLNCLVFFTWILILWIIVETSLTNFVLENKDNLNWEFRLLKLGVLILVAIFEASFYLKIFKTHVLAKCKLENGIIICCYVVNFINIGEGLYTNPSKLNHFCLGCLTFYFSSLLYFTPIGSALLQFISFLIIMINFCQQVELENLNALIVILIIIILNFIKCKFKNKLEKEHSIDNIQNCESKKFYKSFLNLFPDGLAFIGKDLNVEYSNESYSNLMISVSPFSHFIEKLKNIKNINYEPSKPKPIKKAVSLPTMSQKKTKPFDRLKSSKSKKLTQKKSFLSNKNSITNMIHRSSLKKNNYSEKTKMLSFTNSLKFNTFSKRKKIKKAFTKLGLPSLQEESLKKGVLISCDQKRLLHSCNDEDWLISMIFGKVKKVQFTKRARLLPNIFISNHETLYEAMSVTLNNMKLFQERNQDVASFNIEFNSVLVFKCLFGKDSTHEKSIDIRILPIFLKKEPKLILSLNDCTDTMTIELMKKNDEYKNILMSYVTHELRTPLNGMMTILESSKEHIAPEIIDQYIDPSLNCGKNLLCLVNDILDFEQIRKGKMRVFEKEFQLKSVIEEAINIVRLEASRKNLELSIDIDPVVSSVIMTDPNRLRQIVLNLLGNSLKFTITGSIIVHINRFKDEANVLVVTVKDTGLGIKLEDQKKLFKQFGKLDLQDKNFLNTQGVGLGLIISHSLATELGPKTEKFAHLKGLKVKSEIGKGSEFYFLLEDRRIQIPEDLDDDFCDISQNYMILNRKAEFQNQFLSPKPRKLLIENKEVDLSSSNFESANQSQFMKFGFGPPSFSSNSKIVNSPANGNFFYTKEALLDMSKPLIQSKYMQSLLKNGKRCICPEYLIVDDNYFNVIVLENLLTKINRSFEISNNGKEALEKVIQRKENSCCQYYSIILMDCEMPIMNGFQATKKIKKIVKDDKTIIIATTAHTGQAEKEKCLYSGMNDVLIKPISLKQLEKIIKKWELKRKKELNETKSRSF